MWDAAVKRAGIRHRKSYQSRHTYACWSLTAGANPAFIANQMGHADAQMVFQVYGKWMSENNNAQVMNRPGFPGECFICELRLPDHRFRWKH
ncbi:phage integrase family protein, partial [Escherichia coli 90.0091]